MDGERDSRQSFIGPSLQQACRDSVVGVVGLGGGGSHVVQQLAHLGFQRFELFDPDRITISNLNRTVGATTADLATNTAKVELSRRLIVGIAPGALVTPHQVRWQEAEDSIRGCDLLFGCVDGFDERRQLEATARRYLIPEIDIGMDVTAVEREPPRLAGQVILSMPGGPCMNCLGFLNEVSLAREATAYGDAGPRPQVVWANGVLASTAVGLAVGLLTQWHGRSVETLYYSYDGNTGCLSPDVRLGFIDLSACPHYRLSQAGPPRYTKL
jgi:molybdopterin-synthase adenylyltransferase